MADDLDLWGYVQTLMRTRGWDQGDVVRATGLERSLFTRLRTGRSLSHATVQGLARGFGVPEAEFLRRMGYSVEGLQATLSPEPRPLQRHELMRLAADELANDELLSLVRDRMTPDRDDLADYESIPTREYSDKVHTGRDRPRLVVDTGDSVKQGQEGPGAPNGRR